MISEKEREMQQDFGSVFDVLQTLGTNIAEAQSLNSGQNPLLDQLMFALSDLSDCVKDISGIIKEMDDQKGLAVPLVMIENDMISVKREKKEMEKEKGMKTKPTPTEKKQKMKEKEVMIKVKEQRKEIKKPKPMSEEEKKIFRLDGFSKRFLNEEGVRR